MDVVLLLKIELDMKVLELPYRPVHKIIEYY